MRITTNTRGLDSLLRRLDPSKYERAIAPVVEKHARLQANTAANRAPVDSGLLSNSIQSSPKQLSKLNWSYGANVPYAQRQEYEHRTKKGFIRKTVFEGRKAFIGDILPR
ncbi:hypothetical protein ACO11K_000161 [Bacillus cytotoxicus]